MIKKSSSTSSKQLWDTNPQDALFTCALSDPDIAQDFLAQHLPQDFYQALNFTTLEICEDTFIDDKFKENVTYILYRIKFHEGQEAYIRVLLEKQPTAAEEMPLLVLEYQTAVMRYHWDKYHMIPLVHTIVYYTGQEPWPISNDIEQQIDFPFERLN